MGLQQCRGMLGLQHPAVRSRREGLQQGLEGMTCERRRELNLHHHEASCLQGDVITGYKYLQGNNGDRGGELFTGTRWQDREQARLGRGGAGAMEEPGPSQCMCQEPAALQCEGHGRMQDPRCTPAWCCRPQADGSSMTLLSTSTRVARLEMLLPKSE